MENKTIPCIECKNPMPELRLIIYGYKNCVNCSTVGIYTAVNTVKGTGDNTWNEIQILTPEQASTFEIDSFKSSKFNPYNKDA